MTQTNDQLREMVRQKYAEIVTTPLTGCCTPCCDTEGKAEENFNMIGDAYDGISGYVADADLGLSCGVPVEHAGLKTGQTVLDLGSGAGLDVFVTRSEVGETGHVIGVDMTAEMVAKARENAEQSGFDNVEFYNSPAEEVLPFLDLSPDIILLDPPRAGITKTVLDSVVLLNPGLIVYISCDPATLARDAARLIKQGYSLLESTPIDMFPQTFHIESINIFKRASKEV